MDLIGVLVAFGIVIYLISRKVSMGIALLVGTGVAGVFLRMSPSEFGLTILQGVLSPMTIQLIIAVALLSGLGHIMRDNGDFNLMLNSLASVFRNAKVLIMLLPMLIGTINVPGGAIISAPMVEENGNRLGIDPVIKTSVNVFFRHIGFFVYPLYSTMIVASELFGVDKTVIIRNNIAIMAAGLVTAYFALLGRVKSQRLEGGKDNILENVRDFILGFSSIGISLILVLIFDLPFSVAIAIGVVVALSRNLPIGTRFPVFNDRLKRLLMTWIDYKLVLVIVGVMIFQSVIEASGVINTLASSLLSYGIPLPILIISLGLLTAYISGVHVVATGLLSVLFAPLIPSILLGPYISLLFTSIFIGYLLSPIHLCLVLSNQYYDVGIGQVYQKLFIPALVILGTAFVQVLIVM